MRKVLLASGGSLLLILAPSLSQAQTTNSQNYPQKPSDAAGINEIQGQVSNTYFQNNSLKQGAGNVSQGSGSGAADLLKNSTDQQTISVTGASPSKESTTESNQRISLWAVFAFILIIAAPLILILNMLKNLKSQPDEPIHESALPPENTEQPTDYYQENNAQENEEAATSQKGQEKPKKTNKSTKHKRSKKKKK